MDQQLQVYLEMGMDLSNLAEKTFKEMYPKGPFSDTFGNKDEKK